MAVDWFLADAPAEVPAEFVAWQTARARHIRLFVRVWELPPDAEVLEALERAARAAKGEADRLEGVARAAWKRLLQG